jgi:hypothetical protein
LNSQDFINLEDQYGAHNYKPLDVVLTKVKAFGLKTSKATAIWTA